MNAGKTSKRLNKRKYRFGPLEMQHFFCKLTDSCKIASLTAKFARIRADLQSSQARILACSAPLQSPLKDLRPRGSSNIVLVVDFPVDPLSAVTGTDFEQVQVCRRGASLAAAMMRARTALDDRRAIRE